MHDNGKLCAFWHKLFDYLHCGVIRLLRIWCKDCQIFKVEHIGVHKGYTLSRHSMTLFPSNQRKSSSIHISPCWMLSAFFIAFCKAELIQIHYNNQNNFFPPLKCSATLKSFKSSVLSFKNRFANLWVVEATMPSFNGKLQHFSM